MFLRFEDLSRLGLVSLFVLLACSETEAPKNDGTGGGGSNTGGMSSAGSNASGATTGGGGSNSAGNTSGGTNAGNATGGTAGGTAGGADAGGGAGGGSGGAKSKTTFFVSSDTSKTGKLGGLTGADMRCQTLAKAAGFGDHTWHAYLSTSTENAKARIGTGPWMNSKGMALAADLTALHALSGNADLFLDEKGMKINGQWAGSPQPNQHDVLTGSLPDGTVKADFTCNDWTSDSADDTGQVGHCDGLGPQMNAAPPYNSWNSAHDMQNCSDTAPRGGAGRIYCFAID